MIIDGIKDQAIHLKLLNKGYFICAAKEQIEKDVNGLKLAITEDDCLFSA